jgi:hypothetical protein
MKNLLVLLTIFLGLNVFSQTSEEMEMFNELNRFRENPKSYIPLVKEFIELTEFEYEMYKNGEMTFKTYSGIGDGKGKFKFKQLTVEERFNEIFKACDELLVILDTLKPLNTVEFDSTLYIITKKHVDYVSTITDITISPHLGPNSEPYEVRFEKIGYTNVTENIALGPLNTQILRLLIDSGISDRGHRMNILNPNMKKVAIAVNGFWGVQNYVE